MKRVVGILLIICMMLSSVGISVSSEEAVPAFPPVAIANGPESAKIYEEINFTGSLSYDRNGKDDIVSYSWDFDIERDSNNDGVPDNDVDSDEINPIHSYGYTGKYSVKLTVTDSAGLKDEDELTVSVGFDQKHAVIMVGRYFGWLNLNPLMWGPPDWSNLKMMSQYYKWYLNSAGRMYIKLRDTLGFKEENIHLFVKIIDPIKIDGQTFFEIPSGFDSNWADDTSNKQILEQKIKDLNNKMTPDDSLFLCFINHGGNEGDSTYFGCPFLEIPDFIHYIFDYLKIPNPWDGDSGQRLWDYDLASYISGNQGTCVFALQPCYSGGFINELSGNKRVICTASREDEVADSWIGGFTKGLSSEESIADAYEASVSHVNSFLKKHPDVEPYDPLIDDNSDSIGSYFDEQTYDPETYGKDGYLASRIFLGIKVMPSGETNMLPINEEIVVTETTTENTESTETNEESTDENTNDDQNQDDEPQPPDEGEEEPEPAYLTNCIPEEGTITVEEGETVTFSGWAFEGSGEYEFMFDVGETTVTKTDSEDNGYEEYTHTYSQAGTYSTSISLKDQETGVTTDTKTTATITVAANQNNPI